MVIGEVLRDGGRLPPSDAWGEPGPGDEGGGESEQVLVALSEADVSRAGAAGYRHTSEWVEIRVEHRNPAVLTGVVLDTPRYSSLVSEGDTVQAVAVTDGRWIYARTLARAAWAPEAAWVRNQDAQACWLCSAAETVAYVVEDTVVIHACGEHVPDGAEPWSAD